MKTNKAIVEMLINHLTDCMEKLRFKENYINEAEIKRLYSVLYDVVEVMRKLEANEAKNYYTEKINDSIKEALIGMNIRLDP